MIKKLIAAVAALCVAVVIADGITSDNIVGYVNKALPSSKYVLTAVSFESLDQLNNATNLLVTTDAGTQAWNGEDNVPGWYNNAATLMVPNAGGAYDYFYYASDGWDDEAQAEYAGWCDEYGCIIKNLTLTPGLGVWFRGNKVADSVMTVKGAVLADATATTSVGTGYTIIANPFPEAFDVKDVAIDVEGGTAWDGEDNVPGWYNNAPTIMVPNAGGAYDYFYYAKDGWDDSTSTEAPGWCDEYGILVSATVPAGTAVWFKNGEATQVTFTK